MSYLFSSLAGRTAVVTGSSSGIGRAIAVEFARAGATPIVHYHQNRTGAEATAELCRSLGVQSACLSADLSSEAGCRSLLDAVAAGGFAPEIWVNNAGADILTGPAAQLDFPAKLDRLLETDVRSTLLLSKEVGRRMREAGRGVILNIGWDQADRGMEGDSGELFAASKNAIMGFTRSLAVSLAPQVRVNCIAPGWILTAWGRQASDGWQQRVLRETPLGRWGQPEDIAKLARFLCSEDASFITGQVVNCNGGAIR